MRRDGTQVAETQSGSNDGGRGEGGRGGSDGGSDRGELRHVADSPLANLDLIAKAASQLTDSELTDAIHRQLIVK